MKRRNLTADDIRADLAASDADIAAGRLIPGDEILKMIQDRIDRLEARLAAKNAPKIAIRRR